MQLSIPCVLHLGDTHTYKFQMYERVNLNEYTSRNLTKIKFSFSYFSPKKPNYFLKQQSNISLMEGLNFKMTFKSVGSLSTSALILHLDCRHTQISLIQVKNYHQQIHIFSQCKQENYTKVRNMCTSKCLALKFDEYE